jgi:hypothetical protein
MNGAIEERRRCAGMNARLHRLALARDVLTAGRLAGVLVICALAMASAAWGHTCREREPAGWP